jgi:hypothetical protein
MAGGRQEDVSGFDVAVQNAFSMRRIQRVRYLAPKSSSLG